MRSDRAASILLRPMLAAAGRMGTGLRLATVAVLAAASGGIAAQGRLMAVAGGIGVLIVAWFAIGVCRRTRDDAALAVGAVKAVADGNFAERALPVGRDELGE